MGDTDTWCEFGPTKPVAFGAGYSGDRAEPWLWEVRAASPPCLQQVRGGGNAEAAPEHPCGAQHVLLNITSGTDTPRQGPGTAEEDTEGSPKA